MATCRQPHRVQINLGRYTVVISGKPKIGKTTLYDELVRYGLGDPSKGQLLACELGYQAIDGIYATDVFEWTDFTREVNTLINEKGENGIEFVGVDTLDALIETCGRQVVREYNRENQDKRVKTYSEIPWGRGTDKIKTMIMSELMRLKQAGYGLFIITHSKVEKVKLADGTEYDQLIPALPSKAGEAVRDMADFIVFGQSVRDKEGNIIRWMHWRDDGFVTAGGRFKNVPEKTEWSWQEFMRVFTEAVKGAVNGGEAEVAKLAEEQALVNEQKAQAYVEQEKLSKNPDDIRKMIIEKVKSMEPERQMEVTSQFKELVGEANPMKVQGIEDLMTMLRVCG
jgi:hypothetical protein